MRFIPIIGLWLLSQTAGAAPQPDLFPQVARAYLVEIDGIPAWERQPARRLPPASLTKLMTALLVLEQGRLDEIVRISPAATRETGSRLRLRENERFRMRDLLAAMLLQSANDACHALADHLAGSEAAFVERMNVRAQQLGLRDTRVTPAAMMQAAIIRRRTTSPACHMSCLNSRSCSPSPRSRRASSFPRQENLMR